MIFKKKYLLLTFFLIIIFQISLYTNNKQRVSLRYLKWTVQEVSIGKLISISFFSGLFISAFLNTTITGYKKNTFNNKDLKTLILKHSKNTSSLNSSTKDLSILLSDKTGLPRNFIYNEILKIRKTNNENL